MFVVGQHIVKRPTRKISVFYIRISQSLVCTLDLPYYLNFSNQVEVHLLSVGVAVGLEQVEHHLSHFLGDEGEGPLEDIHEVWKHVGVVNFSVLLKQELLLADAKTGSFVIIEIAVIWRRKDSYHLRKIVFTCPIEKPVSVLFGLVSSN